MKQLCKDAFASWKESCGGADKSMLTCQTSRKSGSVNVEIIALSVKLI